MPFLIDGNNLLGRPSGPASEDDAERRELQRRVASRVRSGGAKAILFFDGEPPAGKREGWLGELTVRFAGNRSADDAIVEAVERAKARRDCHVVTDDRGLGRRVRALGARVVTTSDFLARFEEKAAGKAPGAVDVGDWESFFADERNRLP